MGKRGAFPWDSTRSIRKQEWGGRNESSIIIWRITYPQKTGGAFRIRLGVRRHTKQIFLRGESKFWPSGRGFLRWEDTTLGVSINVKESIPNRCGGETHSWREDAHGQASIARSVKTPTCVRRKAGYIRRQLGERPIRCRPPTR